MDASKITYIDSHDRLSELKAILGASVSPKTIAPIMLENRENSKAVGTYISQVLEIEEDEERGQDSNRNDDRIRNGRQRETRPIRITA